jgi:hypothetical protein
LHLQQFRKTNGGGPISNAQVKLNRSNLNSILRLIIFLAETGKLKKLLLLDLDETLVHSENFAENTPYDFIVDFMDYKGQALDVIIKILIFFV